MLASIIHAKPSFEVCWLFRCLLIWREVEDLAVSLYLSLFHPLCCNKVDARCCRHHVWQLVQCSEVLKPHLYFSKHTSCHSVQIAQFGCLLTIKLFSGKHSACPCEQLQIIGKLDRFLFLSSSFFLGWYGFSPRIKFTSLRTVTMLFPQFPVVALVVPVVPEHPKHFPHIWQWPFGSSSRPWQSGDTSEKRLLLYSCLNWSQVLTICSCLEMAPTELLLSSSS